MSNGQDKLDKVGCEFGRKVKLENNFQNEKLERIENKQDLIIEKLDNLKEEKDQNTAFTMIGKDFIKYVVAGIVGYIASIFGSMPGGG